MTRTQSLVSFGTWRGSSWAGTIRSSFWACASRELMINATAQAMSNRCMAFSRG